MDLLTDSELCNNCTVALNVLLSKIVEKAAALTYHLEQTASRMVVLVVNLEMLGKLCDALGEDRNLDLGRTCVCLVEAVFCDNLCLVLFQNHFAFHLS